MRVLLDACVLYPRLVRALLLGAGEEGLLTPFWSPRILAEWRHAAVREGGAPAGGDVDALAARMRVAFPEGEVGPDPNVEGTISLPDAADAHVAAAAIAAGAPILLTFNMRDFPARRLALHGVAARHPDGFLWELLSSEHDAMERVVHTALAPLNLADRRAERNALKRAHLSRFGKAWEASVP